MAPLIVLIVATGFARLIGQLGVPHLRSWAVSTRVGLAVMLFFTAAAHFNNMRPDMIAMVPPFVPNPAFMVTFTGVCEILGAERGVFGARMEVESVNDGPLTLMIEVEPSAPVRGS